MYFLSWDHLLENEQLFSTFQEFWAHSSHVNYFISDCLRNKLDFLMSRDCKDTIQGFVLSAVSFFSHILIMYVNIHSLILLDKSKYFIDNQFVTLTLKTVNAVKLSRPDQGIQAVKAMQWQFDCNDSLTLSSASLQW